MEKLAKEYVQMQGRVHRLEQILASQDAASFPLVQRELLEIQVEAMKKYADVLRARIDYKVITD